MVYKTFEQKLKEAITISHRPTVPRKSKSRPYHLFSRKARRKGGKK